MNDFVDVASLAELPPGSQQAVQVGSVRVLLCREKDTATVWAIQDRCPHAFMPLAGGTVRHGEIYCPKHGACFDLASGRPTNSVTSRPALVYEVQIQGDRICVSAQARPTPH